MGNRLEMRSIGKQFGGVHALQDVNFTAEGGQVHALMGENGAGKSTLMKILSGAYRPDSGQVLLDGEPLSIGNTNAARRLGISVIYQEFSLAKHLSVAENIYLDDLGNGSALVNWRELKARARTQLDSLGLGDLDVTMPVSRLSVAQQQIVEICKALSRRSRVLVFDEPSAVLTDRETQRLFQLIARLKQEGVCIVYISHRLEEIFGICDLVTVLKDGRVVDTVAVPDIDQTRLVQMMVGRELGDLFPRRHATIGDKVLEVRHLRAGSRVADVSFDVRAGEVLGFSGLVGSGRTETLRTVFGADRRQGGEVLLAGKPIDNRSPRQGVLSGIGMLPEDRKHQGVLLDLSIRTNAMMKPVNPSRRLGGWLDRRREEADTADLIKALRVKARDMEAPASSLSGGNQQKVALMKWVSSDCKVLVLDEPTRGVDVGAKIEIYQIINDLAERGVAVIVISSDMPEIIGLCDRVVVMRMGTVAGEVSGDDVNEHALINLAMGVTQ
jgi:ribose transport system ATP-binding protein